MAKEIGWGKLIMPNEKYNSLKAPIVRDFKVGTKPVEPAELTLEDFVEMDGWEVVSITDDVYTTHLWIFAQREIE